MSKLPTTYKALYLDAPQKSLIVKELILPKLENEGDLLIKVESAPINPSDQSFIKGLYPSGKPFPCTPGSEGSGIIVQAKGDKLQNFIGKRVGFTPKSNHFTGSYGEYCVSTQFQVLPITKDVSFDVAASSFVNPVTVAVMCEIAQKSNVKSVVHTAAASQLGRMMNKYFTRNGINVINVIRKQEQADILEKLGAKYILNQNDQDFSQKLQKLSQDLDATICFDAVGGSLTGTVLSSMPNNSRVYLYGGLSGQNPSEYTIMDLIFKGKSVTGFWLVTEIQQMEKSKVVEISQKVSSLLNSDFKSETSKVFSYQQANEAFQYYQQNMTAGKPLIKPNYSENEVNLLQTPQSVEKATCCIIF